MCDPATIAAVASVVGAGATVVGATKAGQKPKPVQAAKKPDAGLTEDERRSRLLAQLAAGADSTNPTGGTAGSFSTGSVLLGA